ncbi:c-type cytochrome biogenesis protein CcmI [Rheinheimera sp. 4Y26]|uniref:c-type cytochrome biogenesis protein CcmI n=1 Tax=Rheinheimera sp. 4Y26 TaxID=2977811 RepID=UPI0021B128C8|nr:c-type cytochrome biogenesis protein CcmI [Rheinheimera sp. 4Y26]MCT6699570.1 c-type cytochrome biogenesis protein CcmI [Rheinheimera sp. 4Y26]
MLMQLSVAALLMLAVVVLLLWWPRKAGSAEQTQTELFAERLHALTQARDNGELAPEDFLSAANELKSQFIGQRQAALAGNNTPWLAPLSLVLVLLVVGIAYGLSGHYRELSDWELAQQNLPSYGERALLNKGEPLSEKEISLFALALRTKLANEGDDAVAWYVLGRIWFSQGLVEDAIEAFEKALKLTPERANVLLSYAQALLVTDNADNLQKAAQSLGLVLSKDPMNKDALSMLALIAQERGDLVEAKAAWEMLLSQLDKNDPRYSMIEQQLAKVSQGAAGVAVADTKTEASSGESATADPAAPKRRIMLTLQVSEALAAKFKDASLFVVAKAAEGPPMPLAVQKLAVFSGSRQIELNSNMVMQPGWGLDNVAQVLVSARISQSGAVAKTAGDPEIVSELIELKDGQQELTLSLE